MTDYLVIYEEGERSCGAYAPDLDVFVVGENRQEAEELIREAIPFHLEGLREAGRAIPQPRSSAALVAA